MKNKKKSSAFYHFAKDILGFIYRLYYNPKIKGKKNIPTTGPIILAGNHKHIMDQCNIIISTKRVINYMAKKEYFDSKYAWFFKNVGCISVNRSIKDIDAKNKAIEVLNNNGAIGIFPEGTRNKTKEFLLPLKFGTVSLAKKTNALIIPFGISGDYKFRSRNLKIKIGKPFKINEMDLESANKLLEKKIKKLMKESVNIL